jgi:intracellular multiplication protein IcmB
LNTTNLAFCLSPLATQGQGGAKLPRIAIIDIGISSSGFISLIKEALPVERRHEADYRRLRMDKLDSINPFDTQLGCRIPLELDKQFLINFLTLLGTDANKDAPSGLSDLVRMVIDEAYEKFSDKSRQGTPRQYIPGVDENIDKILVKYDIQTNVYTTWWHIVDELFKRNDIRFASLAQRYAVPRVEDLPEIANIEQVRNIYGEKKIDDEPLISMFGRIISAALRAYPILTDPTRFDLGEARIVALDLNEAAPQGGPAADKQTALVYMLARFVLARDFYLNKNDLRFFPPEYFKHHEARVRRIAETPKRLVFDEFHRTKSAQSVRDQVVVDMREGRKWGVHIALSSQLLDDFDKNMRSLATGFWILGCSTEQDKKETSKVFGLTQTAVESLNILNGPLEGGKGSPFLVILEMNDGKHEHLLVNTLGPVELWAFSTTLNDVALRNKLVEILGPVDARSRLAKRFPSGSAKKEIERRQQVLIENGSFNSENEVGVISRLAEEIAGLVVPGR